MGEAKEWLFEPSFNRTIKVLASDERITSDAGFLLLREADHRLGLTESLARRLVDPRRQDLIRYQLVELLRERVYALAQGYSAQDDADRLAHDPAMKLAAWDRPGETARRTTGQSTHAVPVDRHSHPHSWQPGGTARLAERGLRTSPTCHGRRSRRAKGDLGHRQLSDPRAWAPTWRGLQRALQRHGLSSPGGELLRSWRL